MVSCGQKTEWDHTWGSRNLGQETSAISVPRRPAIPPSWESMTPDSTFNSQCHLTPLGNQLEMGYWRRVWGTPGQRRDSHLQSQSSRQHTAGGEADGEAEEEQDSPPQELHHEHLEGKERRKGRDLRSPLRQAPADRVLGMPRRCDHSVPAAAAQEATHSPPHAFGRGNCEESMCALGPQGCALAQAVASMILESHLTQRPLWGWSVCEAGALRRWRAVICLGQETGWHLRRAQQLGVKGLPP